MSDKMTIAQALRRVKKLKGLVAESEQRAKASVSYDVSKVPSFRFQDSFDKMYAYQTEMVTLQARVAIANAGALVKDGDLTISMALAIRLLDELKGRIVFLKGLSLRDESIKDRQSEWDDAENKHIYRVVETVFKSDLTEQDRDLKIKALQDHFEVLNNAVEDANHVVVV